MSSNFTVKRLCEQCGNVFEAKTTVTRFCGKLCNKRNFKQRIRGVKMAAMDEVVKSILDKPSDDLKATEFLSVRLAAKLLGASQKIIYSMIRSGRLKAVNLSKRKTTVYRKEIDNLFALPEIDSTNISLKPEIVECYHMAEAQEKFNISEKALYELIKRNHISKFQAGWYTYVAKSDLDKIFSLTV
jgi:excisionase family DNA binding protein